MRTRPDLGNFHDNAAFLVVARAELKAGDDEAAVEMLLELQVHIQLQGDQPSRRLLPTAVEETLRGANVGLPPVHSAPGATPSDVGVIARGVPASAGVRSVGAVAVPVASAPPARPQRDLRERLIEAATLVTLVGFLCGALAHEAAVLLNINLESCPTATMLVAGTALAAAFRLGARA